MMVMNLKTDYDFKQFHQNIMNMLMKHKSCLYANLQDDEFVLSQIPDGACVLDLRDFASVFDVLDAIEDAKCRHAPKDIYLIKEFETWQDGSVHEISGQWQMTQKYPERFKNPIDKSKYQKLSIYSQNMDLKGDDFDE